MLDGLAAQTHRPDAVIVVDNASTDHTREVLDAPHRPAAAASSTPRRTSAAPAASTSACEAAYDAGLRPDLADGSNTYFYALVYWFGYDIAG